MFFLRTKMYWGFVLILIGLLIIVRVLFNVNIPIIHLILGIILIDLGLDTLLGDYFKKKDKKNRINKK